MDSLQHWAGLYFTIRQVSRFMSQHGQQYESKTKFKELQIAWLFGLLLSRNNRKEYLIGFPVADDSSEDSKITLREIIDQNITLDEDFDMVIAPRKKAHLMNHRLQIVRFTGRIEKTTQGLLDFLRKKKFNIPKDENLVLLVWLEKELKLNYAELSQRLAQIDVPYGQIFMVGEAKRNESKNFFCIQVFPETKIMYLDLSFLEKQKPLRQH